MIRGLFDVYNLGTASTLRVEGIDIAGKTGTAENFAKIDGKRVQLKDHSILSLPLRTTRKSPLPFWWKMEGLEQR
jgi:hypothetical protein